VPLIAETGGLNAMVVDSSALLEQVVDDVLVSAFNSAGQRCSALRIIFIQEEVAGPFIEMLSGAMAELVIGDPLDPATDVGPVITSDARKKLLTHIEDLRKTARVHYQCPLGPELAAGFYVPPTLAEISSAKELTQEHFGPILHVVRYTSDDVDEVIRSISASGYGLTLGVQTRIDGLWKHVFDSTTVGNTYVNRSMIGAVVGVQPFGGHGLSGTGPKAGGPHYLQRFAVEKTLTINTTASGGNTTLLSLNS
jgi:RHH-type proline utilization regulon transcriptional repressor/proline dehydrogenase/delta 1-pyrroline-5-carboxylate dehydrogenase